jgi:hypothetical protein
MSCSGSHLGITINIKNTKFVGKNVSKRFFSETTWTIETTLPRNDHWKVLCFIGYRKSKMAATTGHSINTGPYGENTEIEKKRFETFFP